MHRLPIAAAFLVLAPAARAQTPPPGVRVEAVRGRVVLVTDTMSMLRPERPAIASGSAHLEVGAGAEACVVWPNAARLRVWGPSSLEWNDVLDAPETCGVTAFEVGRIESLVERGELVIALPNAWRATFARGAAAIVGETGDRTWIENRAGENARIVNTTSFPVRPVSSVCAGARAHLRDPRAEPLRIARDTSPPWREVTWPFGTPAAADLLPITQAW